MKYLPFFAVLTGTAVAAIPESYEAKLLQGTCDPYGHTIRTGTGWGFIGDLAISPSHTDTGADGLDPTTRVHTQRGMSPYEYFVFQNMTGIANYRIDCSDEEGLYIPMVEDVPGVRVFTSQVSEARLVAGLGLMPEGYGVYVNGERIAGAYLGLGGVVRWGFREVEEENGTVWEARLMVPGAEETEVEGEVYGFLEATE